MIAPSEVREGAGQIEFPLATWEGTKCNRNQPLRVQINTPLWPNSKLTSLAPTFWRDLQPHSALWVYYCGLFEALAL
jgi:hypothetical protein